MSVSNIQNPTNLQNSSFNERQQLNLRPVVNALEDIALTANLMLIARPILEGEDKEFWAQEVDKVEPYYRINNLFSSEDKLKVAANTFLDPNFPDAYADTAVIAELTSQSITRSQESGIPRNDADEFDNKFVGLKALSDYRDIGRKTLAEVSRENNTATKSLESQIGGLFLLEELDILNNPAALKKLAESFPANSDMARGIHNELNGAAAFFAGLPKGQKVEGVRLDMALAQIGRVYDILKYTKNIWAPKETQKVSEKETPNMLADKALRIADRYVAPLKSVLINNVALDKMSGILGTSFDRNNFLDKYLISFLDSASEIPLANNRIDPALRANITEKYIKAANDELTVKFKELD
jgi:hypothetical protein